MTSAVVLSAGAASLATGCGKPPDTKSEGSVLEALWTVVKGDSARVRGPATAEWCDSLRLVQIQSLRGDTGIAIVLYPVKEFGAGRYPVVPPDRADSVPPAAAVAIRWFAETSIRGFQGDSGEVVVREDRPGAYAGTFTARARSVTDGSRLTLSGSFGGLTVRPGGRRCVAKPASPDSGRGVD
ncbi:MAG TPA: hypothetical protein VIG08_15125 [Gemmatimonadales bacterium]